MSIRDASNTHNPTVLEQQAASGESTFRQNDAMDRQGAYEPTASTLVYTSAPAEASYHSAKDGSELLAIFTNRMLKMQQDILIKEHARTLQSKPAHKDVATGVFTLPTAAKDWPTSNLLMTSGKAGGWNSSQLSSSLLNSDTARDALGTLMKTNACVSLTRLETSLRIERRFMVTQTSIKDRHSTKQDKDCPLRQAKTIRQHGGPTDIEQFVVLTFEVPDRREPIHSTKCTKRRNVRATKAVRERPQFKHQKLVRQQSKRVKTASRVTRNKHLRRPRKIKEQKASKLKRILRSRKSTKTKVSPSQPLQALVPSRVRGQCVLPPKSAELANNRQIYMSLEQYEQSPSCLKERGVSTSCDVTSGTGAYATTDMHLDEVNELFEATTVPILDLANLQTLTGLGAVMANRSGRLMGYRRIYGPLVVGHGTATYDGHYTCEVHGFKIDEAGPRLGDDMYLPVSLHVITYSERPDRRQPFGTIVFSQDVSEVEGLTICHAAGRTYIVSCSELDLRADS